MKKNIFAPIIIAAALLCSLTSCGNTPAPSDTAVTAQTTVSAAETSAETTAESTSQENVTSDISTLYNPNFKIEALEDGIRKVTDGDGRELVLVPKSLGRIPVEYADSIVITTPVENAVLLSSTQVCTFRTVDDASLLDSIGGVDGNADTWSDIPQIAERITSGQIADVSGGTGMGEPDYEKIQALNPDIVFVYTGEYGQQAAIAKLDELNINYAVDNEYLETSYLARMEWMRFILTFFNADDAADKAMSSVQSGIQEVKSKIDGMDKPVIAVFSVYNGSVSATSDSGWAGSMIADMGGTNAFSGVDTSAMTMEAAYDIISTADIIVYASTPSYCTGLAGIKDVFPQITECEAYENDRVYQYADCFWHGIDQTDIMACDMAAVIYPDVFADRELTYFVKLSQ